MSIAEEQGSDGHRACLTKFSELLLLNGIISTQQMGVALDLVELLFEQGALSNRPSTLVPLQTTHVCCVQQTYSGYDVLLRQILDLRSFRPWPSFGDCTSLARVNPCDRAALHFVKCGRLEAVPQVDALTI